jgi:hypothetical protein
MTWRAISARPCLLEDGAATRAGWGLPSIATNLRLAPTTAADYAGDAKPHEPGTPLPGVIPGTPGHAPAWGESGTGCFAWGLGLTQPALDRAVLECDGLNLGGASGAALAAVAFGRCHKLALTAEGAAWSWAYGRAEYTLPATSFTTRETLLYSVRCNPMTWPAVFNLSHVIDHILYPRLPRQMPPYDVASCITYPALAYGDGADVSSGQLGHGRHSHQLPNQLTTQLPAMSYRE